MSKKGWGRFPPELRRRATAYLRKCGNASKVARKYKIGAPQTVTRWLREEDELLATERAEVTQFEADMLEARNVTFPSAYDEVGNGLLAHEDTPEWGPSPQPPPTDFQMDLKFALSAIRVAEGVIERLLKEQEPKTPITITNN
jgi:hypothetical protein